MLLDSDDFLDKKTIPNLIHFFNKHYDEVDLVTYPIYWHIADNISLHARYSKKNYDKGTGIYDLDEYPHLNQSTVNIMFKNEFENNLLYDTSMKLSEDQNFNTCLIMRKNRIGFVKNARYFYRRHGSGVSQTRNNPYYCFDDIMSYNESLLTRFEKKGSVPKYIQTLIVNTFNWRAKSDELLPYHYSDKDFLDAQERIINILKHIDDDVIINHSNCDDFVKMYFLKLKQADIKCIINEEGFQIITSKLVVCEDKFINCYIYKVKHKQNKISIFASFESPILELYPIVRGHNRDGSQFEEKCDLIVSKVPFRNTKMKTAHTYAFTYTFDPQKIKSFSFFINVNNTEFTFKPIYIKFSGFVKKYHRNTVPVRNWRLTYCSHKFKITKQSIFKNLLDILKTIWFYPKKRILAIHYFRLKSKTNRKIWLYCDSAGIFDNGYYQFIHDFSKNDGVERYYILDGQCNNLDEYFTNEQKKNIVRHKSKLHKDLYLKCNKIFASFSSLSIYSPFKSVAWYSDLTHYDLIYLQHGILHASLQNLYAKEFTEIDKFVISSDFEKRNLIENYDYSEDDFIMSGMPRMGCHEEYKQAKNKILFAPSWRQYLIGQLINNRRILKDKEFLESDFYKQINEFLHSQELQEILTQNRLELDFKLHPIFKGYKQHFQIEEVPNIDINFEKTVLSEYKMFITDFSSYQFDYIHLGRPIIYFLPDLTEFKAGLHSYRELDLEYQNAFGKLCLNSTELLKEMERIIDNHFVPDDVYKVRMENFFTVADDPCEVIYKNVYNDQ